jgi:hypothetical protein
MSTIDRDRVVLVGKVREVVAILIVVGSVAQDLEAVNPLWRVRHLHFGRFVDPSDAPLYAVDMACANVRLISLFSGNARKRVR